MPVDPLSGATYASTGANPRGRQAPQKTTPGGGYYGPDGFTKFAQGVRSFFTPPGVPRLSSGDIYGGPRAFSGYAANESNAGREWDPATGQAMDTLGQIARTGWSDADRQAQAQAQRQAARNEASQRGAVMQNAAQRGQLNSGNAFLGALQTQQSAANRNMENAAALNIAGANRRQGAAMNMAGLGQQMSAQEMQRAAATDQFNMWAAGMQADARKTEQEAAQKRNDNWWHRISGGLL